MKLTLNEKIDIYFSRYKTGGSFSAKQYLKVREEARKGGALADKIREIRKRF